MSIADEAFVRSSKEIDDKVVTTYENFCENTIDV